MSSPANIELVWDNLLDYIEAGCVIPVVGPGVITHDVHGTVQVFQERLAIELAERRGLPKADVEAQERPRPLQQWAVLRASSHPSDSLATMMG